MCGIAGIVNLSTSRPVTEVELVSMHEALAHRGPDAEGTYHDDEAGLGLSHRRLAIIDLRPEGDQPFFDESGNYGVVYNGEIYNYVELRRELVAAGYRFRTEGDTEVLINGYRAWGDAVVGRLNGMWAFALYDRRRRRLFCSRDRAGEKPFTYAVAGGRFLFASEAKAILRVAPELRRPNYRALALFVRQSISGENTETCFEGVLRLPPAHNLVVENGEVRTFRYWEPPRAMGEPPPFEEAGQHLRGLLQDSIRLRLRSDVPVGITLSGGMDSTAIAALAREEAGQPLDTFTASYNDRFPSEWPQARAFAEEHGLCAHRVLTTPEGFVPELKRIIYHLESPHASPAVLPLWNVMAAAHQKVKVVLEGQAADELLAGYTYEFGFQAIRGLAMQGHITEAYREFRHALAYAEEIGAYGSVGRRYLLLMYARMLFPWSHELYRSLRGDARIYQGPLGDRKSQRPRRPVPGYDRLTRELLHRFEGGLVSLLHYGDALSMAHSVESRLPFTDPRIVEFCFGLPGSYKYRDGYGKALLRHAMTGVLPDTIRLDRKKLGFASPVAQWFREQPECTLFPVLRSDRFRQRGLYNVDAVERLIDSHLSEKADLFSVLFKLVMTELWFQVFVD